MTGWEQIPEWGHNIVLCILVWFLSLIIIAIYAAISDDKSVKENASLSFCPILNTFFVLVLIAKLFWKSFKELANWLYEEFDK